MNKDTVPHPYLELADAIRDIEAGQREIVDLENFLSEARRKMAEAVELTKTLFGPAKAEALRRGDELPSSYQYLDTIVRIDEETLEVTVEHMKVSSPWDLKRLIDRPQE